MTSLQSSMMGLLPQCKYTLTFVLSCMRNWRVDTTRTESLTDVMWMAPLTWPQTMSESLMFLSVSVATEPVSCTTLRRMLEIVAEDSALGEEECMMCSLLWFVMVRALRGGFGLLVFSPSCDAFSSAGVWGTVKGVVAKDEVVEDAVDGCNRLFAANSAASFMEIAEAFFLGNPDLKENFGLGVAWARVF